MKYQILTDENSYLTCIAQTFTEKDNVELDYENMNLEYLNCYKLVDGKIVFDEEKYNSSVDTNTKKKEISRLKAELASTDYQIIKCSECQLLGQPMPYDVAELHEKRQAIRDKINALENVLS